MVVCRRYCTLALATAALALLAAACSASLPLQTLPEVPCAGVDAGEMVVVPLGGSVGLRAPDGESFPAIWPHGFTAQQRADGLVLIDPGGLVVAAAGEQVQIGGGGQAVTGVVTVCEINGVVYASEGG